MSIERLTTALLDLSHAFGGDAPRLMIAGGLGLYLKQQHLEQQAREGRLVAPTLIPADQWSAARATEDIDLLLSTEIIVSAEAMQRFREVLNTLDYVPIESARYYQFVCSGGGQSIKIDLLAADVPSEQRHLVNRDNRRIRPKQAKGILHGRLTEEALAADRNPLLIELSGTLNDGSLHTITVEIPNAFTYLLMKLHAFNDRLNDDDKAQVKHHALDLYRVVAMLTRDELELVHALHREHASLAPVIKSQEIVQACFAGTDSIGVIRAAESGRAGGFELSADARSEFVKLLCDVFELKGR